ncbi:MAG: hypothetical protein R6V28_06295 [Nitriliruptoraceae bacterium]
MRFSCVQAPPIDVQLDAATRVLDLPLGGQEGAASISFHQLDGVDVVRIADDADHYVWSDHIVCHLHDASLTWLVEIQLLGMVLALWLERRGTPTLHASTVVVDGGAVAFLGTKGGGKTTAATALVAAGHPLLVDDLLALELTGEDVLAQPGYPMLRLWPEQVEHFLGAHESLPLVHPAFTKRRVAVGDRFGSHQTTGAPLRRVYLPVRRDGGEVVIETIPSREALIETVRHSFLHDAVHSFGLAGTRLAQLAEVLRHASVRRVTYPSGFDRLPELVAAIEADVAAG